MCINPQCQWCGQGQKREGELLSWCPPVSTMTLTEDRREWTQHMEWTPHTPQVSFPLCLSLPPPSSPPFSLHISSCISTPAGLDYSGKVTHSYRMRSSSRPTDRELRDPATAQNDYVRFKPGYSKKWHCPCHTHTLIVTYTCVCKVHWTGLLRQYIIYNVTIH